MMRSVIEAEAPAPVPAQRLPLYRSLYAQVIAAILFGGLLGHFSPDVGVALKPLGDAFIALVKMIIAPVIFITVASGIAGMSSLKALRSVAFKAFGYFIVVSSFALVVGMVVANVVQPGAGMGIDPTTLDPGAVASYASKAHEQTIVGFLMNIIPTTFMSALTGGDILPVLFVAILFGISISLVGAPAAPVVTLLESASEVFFRLVGVLMKAAPLGAFGAFAFTIGKYGIDVIANLAKLVATFYLTSALFVLLVLGAIARLNGFSILRLISYLRAELLLVLGTSSSESALPNLMKKLETAGCGKAVVGLVVPTGYSFNLDGTNIYMTLAALFIAQATGVDLSIGEQLLLLLVAALSSKGAAGVTGAGFITLAATLAVTPSVPVAGMTLILGIDRFMSECRALTNFIGNAVATIVVSRWEGALDRQALETALNSPAGIAPPEQQ
ncbi:MAG TPA: dicarboxylate/amino acid:cation symporter [Steroidobacter sp.]|uniref:dicarboxylate/amino acid:cation symporter n=1 Tax=Steroidobacter sp. TaxID=1978227 RepID=UPI002ED83C8F